MRPLIMEGFGSKQYEVCFENLHKGLWYVRRLSDKAATITKLTPEDFEEYREIKALWRQKGHAHFNTRCARMRFYL